MITADQRRMMRAALGLSYVNGAPARSYRNAFVVQCANQNAWIGWLGLAMRGLAEFRLLNPVHGYFVFNLTHAGAHLALNPGETLDPEDFPT